MTNNELAVKLLNLPEGTPVFVRQGLGDDAYPPKLRMFRESGKPVIYVQLDEDLTDEHRNWPERYPGVEEVEA